jgi:6,7-dimethyl-8-ribityllumazine synthase
MANFLPSRPRQFASRRTFAIAASQYHGVLVDGLITHFRQEIDAIAPGSTISVCRVPGSFEIPLAVQEITSRGGVDAVIAFGVIIEGETAHGALIAGAVTQGLQQIALATRIPCIHEVLLVKSEEQARARCLDEAINRGTEAARVAVQIAQALSELRR